MIDPLRLQSLEGVLQPQARKSVAQSGGGSFEAALGQALEIAREVRFSAHAEQRLSDRNIQLSDADRARITRSLDTASAKGSREALVLMDRLALVVGVPNRTVITVVEPNAAQDTVFTNIDSVVLVAQDDA